MVGRDIMIGMAMGGVVQVLTRGVQILERSLGLLTEPARLSFGLLESMTGATSILSSVCFAPAIGFLEATRLFTLLVIFRFLFRRSRLTIIATILFFVLTNMDYSSKGVWLDLALGLVVTSGGIWVCLRFGYVATIVSTMTLVLVDSLAWSLNFDSWAAPQTVFAWGLIAALLAYGFFTAVGGRSLFRDPLSDPVIPAQRRSR
jgi:hypothetical protein